MSPVLTYFQPAGSLEKLYDALERAFPFCSDLRERGNGHFHGHLTVGQFKDSRTAKQQIATWKKTWRSIDFVVDCVSLIARRGETPFEVKHRIQFSPPSSHATPPPVLDTWQSEPVLAETEQHWAPAEPESWAAVEPAVEATAPTVPGSVQATPVRNARNAPRIVASRSPTGNTPPSTIAAALQRVDSWLQATADRNKAQLPKSRTKLLAAIQKLIIVKEKPLTGAQILLQFVEERLIAVSDDVVEYLEKDAKAAPLPKMEDNPYGWRASPQDKVLSRCRTWLKSPENCTLFLVSVEAALLINLDRRSSQVSGHSGAFARSTRGIKNST